MTGELFVVATPIGNLGDMVPRAVEVLQSVDVIAAEDTRHSGRLLGHFSIRTPLVAYHDQGGGEQLQRLLDRLSRGQDIALISDAGTPLVSDPGFRLIRGARDNGVRVVPIPGACAAIAALSVAGLPSDKFQFEGFLPAKQSARKKALESVARQSRTLIYYEAPHRILASLQDMAAVFGDEREVAICRELTKAFETIISGDLRDVINQVQSDANQQRGEMVVVVSGISDSVEQLPEEQLRVLSLLLTELPLKKAAALTAKITGGDRKALYKEGLRLND